MPTGTTRVFDIVIAGGSYAGLALAVALHRALGDGLAIALVERRPIADPSAESVDAPAPLAFAIAEGSRAMLEAIGVWLALAPHAEPVTSIGITDSPREAAIRPMLLTYDNTVAGDPQTHIVPARALQQALLEAVRAIPSIALVAPADTVAFEAGGASATLRLADGRALAARLVVAADGARSRVREDAGIAVTTTSYDQTGIVTVVGHEEPHGGMAVQHFLPAGPFAVLPLRGNRSCITWSEETALARHLLDLDDDAFRDELQVRAGWRLGALTLEGPRASWPLAAHSARSLVAPRLALVGDAARSVHPIAGQGVNLGLRDVAALAEALAEGLRLGLEAGDATILHRYARWRRFDSLQSSTAFGLLNALFSNDSAGLRLVRDAGLGLVDRLPGLKQLLVAEAAGQTGEVPRLLRGSMP